MLLLAYSSDSPYIKRDILPNGNTLGAEVGRKVLMQREVCSGISDAFASLKRLLILEVLTSVLSV